MPREDCLCESSCDMLKLGIYVDFSEFIYILGTEDGGEVSCHSDFKSVSVIEIYIKSNMLSGFLTVNWRLPGKVRNAIICSHPVWKNKRRSPVRLRTTAPLNIRW
jgi:hypothetical protein